MKKEEVPQESGITGGISEIRYAVNAGGGYELTPSKGWDAVNVVNRQAWEVIEKESAEARDKVEKGQSSPLLYYMIVNQMDAALLARYCGLSRWRVKLHLKPVFFNKLKPGILQRYAAVFSVTTEQLANWELLKGVYDS
ncbi:MAG: hypothetical protein ACQES8_06505 [Thermodesulfobacteriota bacterium]